MPCWGRLRRWNLILVPLACVTNLKLSHLLNGKYSGSSPSLSVSFLVGHALFSRPFIRKLCAVQHIICNCSSDNFHLDGR